MPSRVRSRTKYDLARLITNGRKHAIGYIRSKPVWLTPGARGMTLEMTDGR